jgi:tetratricopeptide (TPR) repeat protein
MPAPRILYLAGQAHEHIGEQEKALRLYEQGGALPGDSIDIYRADLAAASLYQRLGRLAEAERNYRSVASGVPDTDEGRAARRALADFH